MRFYIQFHSREYIFRRGEVDGFRYIQRLTGPLNIRRNLKTAGIFSVLATHHWATSDFWCAVLSVARSHRSPNIYFCNAAASRSENVRNAREIEVSKFPEFASASATRLGKTSCPSTLSMFKLKPQQIMVSDGVEAFRVSEYPFSHRKFEFTTTTLLHYPNKNRPST